MFLAKVSTFTLPLQVFYQNAIIAAVCQAIAGLVACILSSNCENKSGI